MTQGSLAKPMSDGARPNEYVLGTDAQEAARLGLQHRLWSAYTHLLWERARIQPGMSVLDLGCGPGHATMDLAEIVGPTGQVIAIDESAGFLKQLNDMAVARKMTHIERVLGDVHDLDAAFPNAAESLDAAYARWVFCFLAKPEDVVSGLARLIRSGGRVAIQDYFNYERAFTLAPRREAFSRVISAIGASWRSRGGDPDVMSHLPGMFQNAGFEVEHMDVVQRIARPGTTLWHWPGTFWTSFVPRLVDTGFLTQGDREAFEATWAEASGDPSVFVQMPPVYELIVRKK
jgi:ubiquinone/menaquinone biosynthesis C-methylase UbiE